ncbi:MAG: HDOD domain-containing protein [Desulfobacteraceae bacterium]|nr:HDOD domain-containing protein [Desulfobacteraceae bacterium]
MSFLSLDQLKTGMVTIADVLDANGQLLLPAGKEMESSHLRKFKASGIAGADVKEEDDTSTGENNLELLETAKHYCIPFFKQMDMNQPVMRELFRQAVLYNSQQKISVKAHIKLPGETDSQPCEPVADWQRHLSRSNIKLPESPGIVDELNEVISNPFAVADDIAKIVNQSPGLAASLLKIVNSSFYGFPATIDSISRAVTLIGTREVKNLALGITAMNSFKGIENNLLNVKSFISHSIACGVISRILAVQAGIPKAEQLFVSGLLHDVGRLIIYKYFPAHAVQIFKTADASGSPMFKSEKPFLGARHTRIGAFILEEWKLPQTIIDNVRYHHNPMSAPDASPAAIVHLADVIVNALGIGSSGQRGIAEFDPKVFDHLELPTTVFEEVVSQATPQLAVFESIID